MLRVPTLRVHERSTEHKNLFVQVFLPYLAYIFHVIEQIYIQPGSACRLGETTFGEGQARKYLAGQRVWT
jgi:hypothetical protein